MLIQNLLLHLFHKHNKQWYTNLLHSQQVLTTIGHLLTLLPKLRPPTLQLQIRWNLFSHYQPQQLHLVKCQDWLVVLVLKLQPWEMQEFYQILELHLWHLEGILLGCPLIPVHLYLHMSCQHCIPLAFQDNGLVRRISKFLSFLHPLVNQLLNNLRHHRVVLQATRWVFLEVCLIFHCFIVIGYLLMLLTSGYFWQSQNFLVAPNVQPGSVTASLEPTHAFSSPTSGINSTVVSQPSVVETKPTGRKELPVVWCFCVFLWFDLRGALSNNDYIAYLFWI